MQVINPHHQILDEVNPEQIMKKLELCGRIAYKSEDKITQDSAERFIKALIDRGHESVIEHVNLTIKFVCDRGISHELVRHRLASYTQESTRYVNYAKKGMTVIKPSFFDEGSYDYILWLKKMEQVERDYNLLIERGYTPQQARCILPNCLKTEIVATTNLREWRHILKLRTASDSHPQMRELMVPLLNELKEKLPVIFGGINEKLYL